MFVHRLLMLIINVNVCNNNVLTYKNRIMTISTLFVLEVINICIAVVFLLLFLYRLHYLRHFSQTDKYLNYYPKIRILFAVLYVLLSLSLLGYNIGTK